MAGQGDRLLKMAGEVLFVSAAELDRHCFGFSLYYGLGRIEHSTAAVELAAL